MKILVTGAGGFIGSALVRELARTGRTVRAHLGALGDPVIHPEPDVETRAFDIGDDAALRDATAGVDAVVHLAGPAAVAPSFSDPVGYARAHVVGTAAVLAAIEASNVPHVVYVSSAEIYGRPDRDPVDESAPVAPRSPYGAAKAAAETLVACAVRRDGCASAIVLRPFSVYGPGQRKNSLLSSLLRQAKFEAEIVLDDLRPVRDYVYVDDLVAAVRDALDRTAAGFIVANIASGVGVSVGDLARLVTGVTGRNVPIRERGATRPADAEIDRLVADVSQAHRSLGWIPRTALADGLVKTLAHVGDAA